MVGVLGVRSINVPSVVVTESTPGDPKLELVPTLPSGSTTSAVVEVDVSTFSRYT